jgi:exopolysaccharide biosynthesis polyprenyl glycosylphosphotransferase
MSSTTRYRTFERDRETSTPSRPIPVVRLVAAIDVVTILLTFLIVLVGVNFDRMTDGLDSFLAIRVTMKNVLIVLYLTAGALLAFRAAGLYDASRLRRWSDEARRVVLATTVITAIATIAPLTSLSGAIDYWALLWFWAGTTAALLVTRGVRSRLAWAARERRRVIVVGTGPLALRLYRELCSDLLTPCHVVGFVDDVGAQSSPFLERRTLGTLDQLEAVLVREHVDEVYVGLPVKSLYRRIQETIRVCERLGVKAMYHADIFNTELARPLVEASSVTPRVQLQVAPEGPRLIVKRLIDIAGASVAIVLASPLMLLAAVAIKLTSAGPVIYAQERCGLNRQRFHMFKFRTMVRDADRLQAALESRNEATGPVFKIERDPRITNIGRVLRRTSIDELPQLFNVLRGDMSLVGPRPLPLRDVSRFNRTDDWRRFCVRPGITCLWQVNSRNSSDFDGWIELDLRYIDQWSLGLDFLILVRTVPAVLRGTGAR